TTLQHRTLRIGGTSGLALHATSRDYVRLWVSGLWRREVYEPDTATMFPDSVFGMVGTGLDVGHVRFQVLERLNSFARREDVDISQLVHLGVWAAPRAWGYSAAQAGVGVEASAQLAAPWPGGFAVAEGASVALVARGVAPFFGYGGAWYANELPRLDGDIGVSVRIGPTRSARAAVGEIAVGYRFGEGVTGRRWGLTIRKAY